VEENALRYIALDLDKRHAYLGTFDSETRQRHQERIPLMNDAVNLKQFLSSLRPDDLVAMEAQPGSFYLYDLCKPIVKEVYILESHRLAAFLKLSEAKTDRNDTGTMLDIVRAEVQHTVWVPTPEVRAQRLVATHYKHLHKQRTRCINRIHAILLDHGLAYEATTLLDADAREAVARLKGAMSPAALSILASTLRLLRLVEEELALVGAQLQATEQPLRELAMTLPGLGAVLATAALAAIGDPARFKSADSLSNYTLAPSLWGTGGKTRTGKTKRRGSTLLRWAMVEAANSARRVPGPIRDRYIRLRRRGKGHGTAIVAVARKMLEVLWHMLTRREPYRVPAATEQRKQRRRRRKDAQAQQILKNKPDTIETLRQHISSIREVFQIMASS
jgi:transposase